MFHLVNDDGLVLWVSDRSVQLLELRVRLDVRVSKLVGSDYGEGKFRVSVGVVVRPITSY